jgi:CheY-like chemotaxis protein
MQPVVLYAEDEPNDVFFLQLAFQQAGVTAPLMIVTNGLEAEEYLFGRGNFADRQKFPVPTLVILDINMPIKSGLEVLETMRSDAALRAVPVIILSSSAQGGDIERAQGLGIEAYVVKPSNPTELTRWVSSLRPRWFDPSPATEER